MNIVIYIGIFKDLMILYLLGNYNKYNIDKTPKYTCTTSTYLAITEGIYNLYTITL
jgi:hypothetical protein